MLVFGIYNLRQLRKYGHLGVLGARKEIALDLYVDCSELPCEERNWMQEAVLRNASSATAAFKRTQARRFDDFDEKVSAVLSEAKSSLRDPLKVHDIGVSDGRTTVQFHHMLDEVFGGHFHIIASDLDIEFFTIQLGGRRRGIFDVQGTCLQLVAPPFVFSLRAKPRSRFTILNNFFGDFLDRYFAERLRKTFYERRSDAIAFTPMCKEFCDLKRKASNIDLVPYDVLQSDKNGPFGIVRAMNVLNRSYFCDSELTRAIGNIHEALTDGGVFVTGSNQDAKSEVMGGVYQKSGRTFKTIAEFGGGSPVSDLILSGFV